VSKIICSQSRPTLPRAGVGRKPTSLYGGASASLKTIVRSPPPDCASIFLALFQQQPYRLDGNYQQRHGDDGQSDRARDHKQKLQVGWYPHPLDNPAIAQKCPLGFAKTVSFAPSALGEGSHRRLTGRFVRAIVTSLTHRNETCATHIVRWRNGPPVCKQVEAENAYYREASRRRCSYPFGGRTRAGEWRPDGWRRILASFYGLARRCPFSHFGDAERRAAPPIENASIGEAALVGGLIFASVSSRCSRPQIWLARWRSIARRHANSSRTLPWLLRV